MRTSLKDLNEKRKAEYYKDRSDEDFFLGMNKFLQTRESEMYRDYDIEQPIIFIFGLPRSGTTLMAQLIAYSQDVGYIDNLAARFWLAPVHGIRLSKSVLAHAEKVSYQSEYARTSGAADIHEFGYFWRYWLKKETVADNARAKEREDRIDWTGLKKTLANMQREFARPMLFKNMFGAYHLKRLYQTLGKVLYVYIQRDPLDVAVSILDARRKHYSDPNNWWSNIPVEYDELKDLDYWEQIAGQTFYLNRFYSREINLYAPENTVKVDYEELCLNPSAILEMVREKCREQFDFDLQQIHEPPASFPYRTYNDREAEKEKFKNLMGKFSKKFEST